MNGTFGNFRWRMENAGEDGIPRIGHKVICLKCRNVNQKSRRFNLQYICSEMIFRRFDCNLYIFATVLIHWHSATTVVFVGNNAERIRFKVSTTEMTGNSYAHRYNQVDDGQKRYGDSPDHITKLWHSGYYSKASFSGFSSLRCWAGRLPQRPFQKLRVDSDNDGT